MKDKIQQISEKVAKWTRESGSMLPKSPEEIAKFIKEDRAVLVEDKSGNVIGFGAQTFDWPDGWKELGAVVVDPDNRHKGYGQEVTNKLTKKAKKKFGGKLFGLCNKHSLPLALNSGAKIIEDPDLLPKEVWEECLNCPNFKKAKAEGKLCCDTPVKF